MPSPSTQRRTLAWFRDDLRTDDHRALHAAIDRGTAGFTAIFVATREQWRRQHWGPNRIAMVEGAVRDLQRRIEACGGHLHVFEADADLPSLMRTLIEHWSIDEIHANREFGIYEDERDRSVESAIRSTNATLVLHEDQTILPVREIRSGSGTPYTVFTPFKKNWLKRLAESNVDPLPCPKIRVPLSPPPALEHAVDPENWPSDAGVTALFPPGEETAQSRLAAFLDEGLTDYDQNRDLPAIDGTSTLSPWLACGSISPRRILRDLRDRLGDDPSSWGTGPSVWLSELVWREFYRHVMDGIPRLSMDRPLHGWTDHVAWRDAPDDFEAWTTGRTGVALVDAGMRQLAETGWMHNRVRMVVATFLTKHLLIDWRLGERFFMESLVDADFCSNNGGWQWAASTGTDAAPYFRVFNPDTQRDRFDGDSVYVGRWAPEHRSALPPSPIVDLKAARVRAIEAFKTAKQAASPVT